MITLDDRLALGLSRSAPDNAFDDALGAIDRIKDNELRTRLHNELIDRFDVVMIWFDKTLGDLDAALEAKTQKSPPSPEGDSEPEVIR